MKTLPREVWALWAKQVDNYKRMGKTVLAIMRHPDATPEHLAQAHKVYTLTAADLRAMEARLQREFVNHRGLLQPRKLED